MAIVIRFGKQFVPIIKGTSRAECWVNAFTYWQSQGWALADANDAQFVGGGSGTTPGGGISTTTIDDAVAAKVADAASKIRQALAAAGFTDQVALDAAVAAATNALSVTEANVDGPVAARIQNAQSLVRAALASLGYATSTAVNDAIDAAIDALTFSAPVTKVNGQIGDVSLGLGRLTDVTLDAAYTDPDTGQETDPGPEPGDFLGVRADGTWGNIKVDDELLGLPQKYAPKDPNASFLLYGVYVPPGGTVPTNLPDKALILDGNKPERPLYEPVNTVTSAGSAEALTPPTSHLVHDLTLTAATCAITLPQAVAGVIIEVTLRQDDTGGRLATWSTNVKWQKAAGGTYPAPTLQTGSGQEDTFIFRSYGTTWRCIGHFQFAGPPMPGPTPTVVGAVASNTGTANNATTTTFTWPASINADDVAVMAVSLSGGSVLPADSIVTTDGWTLMSDSPATNHDTTPSLRTYVYKKKLAGTEDGGTYTVTAQSSVRILVSGVVLRGADFDRVTLGPVIRDTSQDTTLELPATTPLIANTLIVALSGCRHGTGSTAVPSTTLGDTTNWTERADHYEGRPLDGLTVQYSAHAMTRPVTGGANTEITHTSCTYTVTGTTAGFMVYAAPVNV